MAENGGENAGGVGAKEPENVEDVAARADDAAKGIGAEPGTVLTSAQTEIARALEAALVGRLAKRGANPEYQSFADSVRTQAYNDSAFDFVANAVNGRGGFETGDYLDPHVRETQSADTRAQDGSAGESLKFRLRRRVTDYDNFARSICWSYPGYIAKQRDEIRRVVVTDLVANVPPGTMTALKGLQEFWANVDRKKTSISTFMEGPQGQARMYGYAVVVVDRPQGTPENAAMEDDPEFRPYAYHVASRNFVDWVLDEDGKMVAAAILEPEDEDVGQYGRFGVRTTTAIGTQRCPVRVWTRWTWGVYELHNEGSEYVLTDSGEHNLGEVPVVVMYNKRPSDRCLLGTSEMREIALIAKTKYNLDSEIRELQRNTCFPFLWVPMKNPAKIASLTISTMGATATDGTTAPAFISPDTTALASLREAAKEKVEQAYAMASLAAVTGYVQTSSGFHTQAEFDKTNRAISAFAANVEDAERKIARLYLRYRGVLDEAIEHGGALGDSEEPLPLYTVVYPKDFNIQDPDLLVKRTTELLALGLGEKANALFLADLFSSLYPKLPSDAVKQMAEDASASLNKAADAATNAAGADKTARRAGLRERVRALATSAGERAAMGVKAEAGPKRVPGAAA